MKNNIVPGLQISILDREFKKKHEERARQIGLTSVQLRVLGELSRLEATGVEEINQKFRKGVSGHPSNDDGNH